MSVHSLSFENKVILIVGASSGIGATLAREFASLNASVVLVARRLDRLQALSDELKKKGCRTLIYAGDVTRDGDLETIVRSVVQEWGQIDVVLANAGFGVAGPIEELTLDDYRRQFETNVFGVLRTFYSTIDELKKTRGVFAVLGSVAGVVALPGNSPYAMSKFAIHALAKSIGPELRASGVAVVLLAPGFVESEIRRVDNQGVFRPESKEDVIRWLVVPTVKAAREIIQAIHQRRPEKIITGHGKIIVWIYRHFPWVFSLLVNQGLRARTEPK